MSDNEITREKIIEDILAKCPGPVISRRQAAVLSGGMIGARSLANLDCCGEGPAERVRMGKRVGYTARSFAEWLATRIESK